MGEIKDLILNPAKEYGIYPIIHDSAAEPEHILKQNETLNYAGAVVNVHYTKDFPNDTAEWQRFETGCRRMMSTGMKLWIYDEKGYPSGSAGGAVLETYPEYENIGLVCFYYWKTLCGPSSFRADTPEGKLFGAFLIPLSGGDEIDITDTANESGTLYFEIPDGAYRLLVLTERRLFDGTHAAHSYSEPRRYIDLFNKDATRAFINITHEKYKSILNDEFGKGIRAFFTDEPSLFGWGIPPITYPYISWSSYFSKAFQKCYGYEIHKAVIAVLGIPTPDAIVRRCDFWEFTAAELSENYFGELRRWCAANNIPSSGHLLCEENLLEHVFCYGSYYKCCKQLDWPGIDQLESEPDRLMCEELLPIGRLAASIADVFDSGETFTEASDHTSVHHNRRISIDWVKASINWHMAMGVNNITSYYNFSHYNDLEVRELNRYTSILGGILRKGIRRSRVAVLYPENTMWALFQVNPNPHSSGQSEEAQTLHKTVVDTSWALLNRQIDFDYIDEEIINEGDIKSGKLFFRRRIYDTVILPGASVIGSATAEKLSKFTSTGGTVIAAGEVPKISRETGAALRISGCIIPETRNVKHIPFSQYIRPLISFIPDDYRSLMTGFEGSISAANGEILSKNLLAHTRIYGDDIIIFVCNMGSAVYNGHLCSKEGLLCRKMNPNTADEESFYPEENGVITAPFELMPYESTLFILKMPSAS